MDKSNLRENLLLGIGNPLLDISATVDKEFLDKYGMKENDAILAGENHKHLFDELIEKYEVSYLAGGSVQNTLRVAQWLLEKPKVTTFLGCVGDDKFSKILNEKATSEGVNVRYQYNDTEPTGTCAVLITNHHRSLCANLGSANCFTIDHIRKPQNKYLIETAQYYYVSGFFLTVNPPSQMEIAKIALANDRPFIMNLSAPFICQMYIKEIMQGMPYVDIIFGNETIAEDPIIGKCLIATRDIKAGEQILSESPLVSGPRPHFVEEGPVPCPGCCRLIIGQQAARCKGCDFPVCSPDCPGLQDPNKHGQECMILGIRAARAVDGLHEFYRQDALLALRCLLLQSRKPQKFTRLMEMEAHLDKRKEGTDIYREVEDRIVDYLLSNFIVPLKLLEAKSGVTVLRDTSKSLLHQICGIIDVNGLEISQDAEATALYPTACLLEHDCLPNTAYSFDEGDLRVTVRAAVPIRAGDHVTTMYTHCLWGTQARREHLRETKYFACSCRRCGDPTEMGSYLGALRCIGVEEEPCTGTQLPINPLDDDTEWACDKCDVKVPNAEVIFLVNGIGEEVDNLQFSNPTIKELESVLNRMLTFLHPNHYHVYTVKHSLVQLYGHQQGYTSNQLTDDCLVRKTAMCKELLDINSKIDPGNSRLPLYTVILLHELFLANWTVIKRKWDLGIKTKVKSVLTLMLDSKQSLEQAIEIMKREKNTPPGEKLFKQVRTSYEEFQKFVERNKIDLPSQKVLV